jgi:hypothetical protein
MADTYRAPRLQGASNITPPGAAADSHGASLSFPSDNDKISPIALYSTSRHTCPSSCPLSGDQGCYAEAGFHIQQCLARIDELDQRLLSEQELLQRSLSCVCRWPEGHRRGGLRPPSFNFPWLASNTASLTC